MAVVARLERPQLAKYLDADFGAREMAAKVVPGCFTDRLSAAEGARPVCHVGVARSVGILKWASLKVSVLSSIHLI